MSKSSKNVSKQSETTDTTSKQSELVKDEQNQSESKKIQILKPITETITFKNENQFSEYYTQHKEELDKLNTNKLNKMFLVPEFKITKVKVVLSLKSLTPSKVNHTVKLNDQDIRITELETKINQIITFLDSQFDSQVDEFIFSPQGGKELTISH
jgi:hypothetical protein